MAAPPFRPCHRFGFSSPPAWPKAVTGMGLQTVVIGLLGLITATIPMQRRGRPEKIAKAMLFVASDDSSY